VVRKAIPKENIQHETTQKYSNPGYLKYGFISSSFNNQEPYVCNLLEPTLERLCEAGKNDSAFKYHAP
jgi:hypothetical protein